MTTKTNIAPAASTNAAHAYFTAENTLYAKRHALGAAFVADGFDLKTDFTAKTAKEAGRKERYDAVRYMAMTGFPASVTKALRDDSIHGDKEVTGNGVTKTKTEWSTQLPGKIRTLASVYGQYLKEIAPDSRNGEEPEKAKAGATKAGQGTARNLNTRVYAEIAKLEKAVKVDREAGKEGSDKTPEWAGSYDEILVAFSRILGMIDKKFHPTK
jgi:hypothetical protein